MARRLHGNASVHRDRRVAGFTLIELMTAIVLTGVLATLAFQSYGMYVARAKRSEATLTLNALSQQQEHYKLRYLRYAGTFDELGFRLEGGESLSPTSLQGRIYQYTMSQPWGIQSWYCSATANIDGDAWLDVPYAEVGNPAE